MGETACNGLHSENFVKPSFRQIDKNSEMAPGKKKTGNDSKPSTSKGTANSEENIRPKRQATKKVKPGAMLDEDSSGDDFEPSPPKAVKKSPQKPSKKDMKKSSSKPKKSQKKEKKVLAPI